MTSGPGRSPPGKRVAWLARGPRTRDFRFGVVWVDRSRNARPTPGFFGDAAAMDIGTVRLIPPNNDLQLRCGDRVASRSSPMFFVPALTKLARSVTISGRN